MKESENKEEFGGEEWFTERYTEDYLEKSEKNESKIKEEKHPFFDIQSHYPKETAN